MFVHFLSRRQHGVVRISRMQRMLLLLVQYICNASHDPGPCLGEGILQLNMTGRTDVCDVWTGERRTSANGHYSNNARTCEQILEPACFENSASSHVACGKNFLPSELMRLRAESHPPLFQLIQIIDGESAQDPEQDHHAFGVWLKVRKDCVVWFREPGK